jgi:selenium metabolism protein YedF
MLAKAAVDGGAGELEVRVDNAVAASNVTRFLEGQGFEVHRTGEAPRIAVSAHRTGEATAGAAIPVCSAGALPASGDWGLLLLTRTLGTESLELGEALMKAFLGVTAKRDPAPKILALMNGAVLMALPEASESETLREILARGTEILVCGTCTKQFGVTERVCVGRISNMFEIVEAVFDTPKPVVVG